MCTQLLCLSTPCCVWTPAPHAVALLLSTRCTTLRCTRKRAPLLNQRAHTPPHFCLIPRVVPPHGPALWPARGAAGAAWAADGVAVQDRAWLERWLLSSPVVWRNFCVLLVSWHWSADTAAGAQSGAQERAWQRVQPSCRAGCAHPIVGRLKPWSWSCHAQHVGQQRRLITAVWTGFARLAQQVHGRGLSFLPSSLISSWLVAPLPPAGWQHAAVGPEAHVQQ